MDHRIVLDVSPEELNSLVQGIMLREDNIRSYRRVTDSQDEITWCDAELERCDYLFDYMTRKEQE